MTDVMDGIEVSRSKQATGLEIPINRPKIGDRRAWRAWAISVSAAADVLYPFDPKVMKAIHKEFDPWIVPLIIRRVYRSTSGGFRVARFHAFARRHSEMDEVKPFPWTQRLILPLRGRRKPRPTVMLFHGEDRTTRLGDGLPGRFLPFGWRYYHAIRVGRNTMTPEQKEKFINEHGREAKARKRSREAAARAAQIHGEDRAWLKTRVENMMNDRDLGPRLLQEHLAKRKPKLQIDLGS